MNPALVATVWALVALDCALMGYRLEMGRSALLDKRRRYQRASVRAGVGATVPLTAVTAIAVVLVERGGPETAAAFDSAMGRFVVVGGAYAAIILGTWALCALPSLTVQTGASVVVFGPLTLLRPAVVVLTVAAAVGPDPSVELVLVGLLVAVPGVTIEPVLDRRIARALVG